MDRVPPCSILTTKPSPTPSSLPRPMPRSPSPHPLLSYSSPPTRLIVAGFKPLKGRSGHLQSQDERCNKDSHPSHLPLHPIIVLCQVPNTCIYRHTYSCPITPPRGHADSPLQTASPYRFASSLLCFSTHPKHTHYVPLYLPTRLGAGGAARVGRYDTKEWSGRVSRLRSPCRSPLFADPRPILCTSSLRNLPRS